MLSERVRALADDETHALFTTELDRLDLIDEYKLLVHPRIASHGPTLYQDGLPGTRQLSEDPRTSDTQTT